MSKLVLFDDEAYEKIKNGVEQQKKAVGATLGPRAHNVIFKRPFGTPGVVHDGVQVSKELDPPDQFEAAAQEIVKNAATSTNEEAGDGTTTATILTYSLFMEGRKLVTAGHNAQMLRKGVEKAVDSVVQWLTDSAIPIKSNEQQLQVANIASQNEKIGGEVARAFKKLGDDAVIAVEESKQNYIYSEYKDGMEIDQGWFSRYFETSEPFHEATIENANIVVTDFTLSSIVDIQLLMNSLHELEIEDNIVIISPDVKEVALAALIHNKLRGLHLLAVRAPGFGDEQLEKLEDIAISVGGRLISKGAGRVLDVGEDNGIAIEDIGHAQKVVASKDSTTIVNGAAHPDTLKQRVESLKNQLSKETTSEFEGERLQERIAKLTSGIAIINVGARGEGEAKELKERAIDAVGAIKAANKLGIVAGGETPLLRASWELEKHLSELKESEEIIAGYKLVIRAMQWPFKTLMENSGLEPGQMLERLLQATETWPDKAEKATLGVDAIDGLVKDLLKAGVIDPVLVPMSALQNAASAAMSLLTSGVIISDDKKVDEENTV